MGQDTGPCILVVEDDHDIRDMLAFALRSEGYHVVGARNGQVAFEALRGGLRAYVTLLDLTMPVMNGHEFLDAVRGGEGLEPGAIIVLSGDGDIARKTADLGLDGFLRKPVDLSTLLSVVKPFVA